MAETLADDLGVATAVLDPIEGLVRRRRPTRTTFPSCARTSPPSSRPTDARDAAGAAVPVEARPASGRHRRPADPARHRPDRPRRASSWRCWAPTGRASPPSSARSPACCRWLGVGAPLRHPARRLRRLAPDRLRAAALDRDRRRAGHGLRGRRLRAGRPGAGCCARPARADRRGHRRRARGRRPRRPGRRRRLPALRRPAAAGAHRPRARRASRTCSCSTSPPPASTCPTSRPSPTRCAVLKERGATIVLVAHELGPMEPLIDRAVVMRDGRVAYDGPPLAQEVASHDAPPPRPRRTGRARPRAARRLPLRLGAGGPRR